LLLGANALMTVPSLLRHPHCGKERILEFQNKRLRRVIRHAYEHVPYYRRLFDEHQINPRDIRTTADLPMIPLTTKDDLRACTLTDTITSGLDPEKMLAFSTSGFSGDPFTIRRTGVEQRVWNFLWLRTMHYLGLKMWHRIATIAYIRNKHGKRLPLTQRVVSAFGCYRHQAIDCRQQPQEIADQLRAGRPDVIRGYPNLLLEVARTMNGSDRQSLRPRLVLTFGETSTDAMRKGIAAGFNAPVYDMYGGHELGMVAWSCKESTGLHVCDDSVIVEILKDGRPALPGEKGELVGTNLHVLGMPFIRYRLGDIVVKGQETCACGQPFATLSAVEGRAIDYFPMPDGSLLHPYTIVVKALDVAQWIRRYQLVQGCTDRIVMRIVPLREVSQEEVRTLEAAILPLLDANVVFKVDLVPDIKTAPGGKHRVSRSLVRSAYNGVEATVQS